MKFHLSKRTKKLNKAASLIKNYKYMYIKLGVLGFFPVREVIVLLLLGILKTKKNLK